MLYISELVASLRNVAQFTNVCRVILNQTSIHFEPAPFLGRVLTFFHLSFNNVNRLAYPSTLSHVQSF